MLIPLLSFNNDIDREGKIICKEKEVTENETAFISILTKPGSTLIKHVFHIPERNHRPGSMYLQYGYQVMVWHCQNWRTGIGKYNLHSRREKRVDYSLAKSDFSNVESS